jgi:hypothetical protein
MAGEVFPTYVIPLRLLGSLAAAFISGRKRSFREDTIHLLSGMQPPIHIEAPARLPQGCPVMVTVNHYSREGFSVAWVAAAVSACLPGEVYWTMTAALTDRGGLYEALSRAVIHRFSRVYGFNLMPPMPPRPQEARQRSLAVKRLMDQVKANPQGILGFAPEGRDIPGGVLGWPPPGVGRLMAQLGGMGVQFLPCAVYEQSGRLVIGFGECYRLELTGGMTRDEVDRLVSHRAMVAIARLLPGRMRAEFTPPEG